MNATINYKMHKIKFYDLLTIGHNVDKKILTNRLYSGSVGDHQFELITKLLKKGSVIYDIGAYIGSYSIPLSLENMEVYAFEGFPDNFKRLQKNCVIYDTIYCHLIALSNKAHTTITKFNDCTGNVSQERTIKYVIFDEYIKEKEIPAPNLVKIDIEGMETLALHGMTNLLEKIRPIWQLGYHKGLEVKYEGYPGFVTPENGGFDFTRFDKLNYAVYNQMGYLLPPHKQFQEFGEYICIPTEKIKKRKSI